MTNLLFSDLTYYLRGVCFDIHNELRPGHRETDYENVLAIVLESDGVPFQRQPLFRIDYRGKQIGKYFPDLMLADGNLLLELKARPLIDPLHKAQVLSYLRVTNAKLGMILNFGAESMQFERLPNFLAERRKESAGKPEEPPSSILFPELSARVLAALHYVHRKLGPGYLSQVYRRAVRIELAYRYIAVAYIRELPLHFRGLTIGRTATRLFLIDDKFLLAVVAVRHIRAREQGRMRWALNATGHQLGLIANFYPTELSLTFVRSG